MFVNGSKMSNLYRGPFIDATYYESVHLSWPAQAIRVADWPIHKKSSPLKLLGQMNRNLIGSSYGRPSIKIAHFVSLFLKDFIETLRQV
jgi:hypothetical protein